MHDLMSKLAEVRFGNDLGPFGSMPNKRAPQARLNTEQGRPHTALVSRGFR